ncbi:hypothetical protein D3C80_2230150 [compost metagenome]
MSDIATKEYLALRCAKLHWTELLTHTILNNHATYDAGSLLEVAISTCTYFTNKDFLRSTGTE